MKPYIFFLLIIIGNSSNFAQTIKGKIVDTHNIPIEFANIYTSTSSESGVSNEEGNFSITFSTKIDTLIVSHIAYEIIRIPLKIDSFYIIRLREKPFNLNEITIKPRKPSIDLIINAFGENYPTVQTTQNCQFISQNFTKDSLILGYFDGIVNLSIKSYLGKQKNMEAHLVSNRFVVNNFKKIPDFYYKTPSNILKMVFPENLPFIKDKQVYTFQEEGKLNDSTAKLSFYPKSVEKFKYEGYLYYDINTYAISYIQLNLLPNEANKDKLIAVGLKKSSTFTYYELEKIKIFYKKRNDKYELDKLSFKSLTKFNNSSKNYLIHTNLNVISVDIPLLKDKLDKFNLFQLKTSKNKAKNKVPYLDSFQKQIIEKYIEEELKNDQ